jgi:phage shock protein A
MAYQIRLVPQVESWLAELRVSDRVLATQVDEAVEALRVAGESLGPPMVIPVDDWPARSKPDLRQTLDYAYQRQLESLTKVRRGVADVATSRKRVQLQVEQLDRQAARLSEDPAEDAATSLSLVLEQATVLRDQHGQLLQQEERLTGESMRLQRKIDAFRTRKETIKASQTAAEGAARAEQAMELLNAQIDEMATLTEDGCQPQAEADGEPAHSLDLYELRPGAPDRVAARILFTLDVGEPGGSDEVALLLAAGAEEDWLRAWYQDAVLLCRSRYRQTQSPPDQAAG